MCEKESNTKEGYTKKIESFELCRFKKTGESKWEPGILINEEIILDVFGNRPEEVWDYKREGRTFCINLGKMIETIQAWCDVINDPKNAEKEISY